MHIGILGATGRTGRLLVASALAHGERVRVLARKERDESLGAVEWQRGDLLDAQAMSTFAQGLDAIVCVLGPAPNGPPDVCSRATALVVRAMQAHGVRRLVVVTGAMIGYERLGPFYRFLRSRKGLRDHLAERREQERIVRESNLDWILVRPPQLTNGESRGAVWISSDVTIRMRDSVPRAQLAQALLTLISSEQSRCAVTVVDRLGASAPGRVWLAWLLAMGGAELLGIAFVATVAMSLDALFGEPTSLTGAVVRLAPMVAAGCVEGALLGWLPSRVLRDVLPATDTRALVRNTTLVAAGAWLVGMLPSTLRWNAAPPVAAEPSLLAVASWTTVGGLVGGALIGLAQSQALKRVGARTSWVAATALGWACALPLDFAGAMLPSSSATWPMRLVSAAVFGLAAGCVVALPTGAWLVRAMRIANGRAANPPNKPA